MDVPVKGVRTKAEDAELETLYKAAAVAFARASVEDYSSGGIWSNQSFGGLPVSCGESGQDLRRWIANEQR